MKYNKNKHKALTALGRVLRSRPCCWRYVYMRFSLLSLFFFGFNVFACELSPEYIELRNDFAHKIREPYNSCKKATNSHLFYKAVVKCKEEGRGENIAGGCYHVVGYEVTHDKTELEHCEVLKPTTAQSIKHLEEYSKEKGISKCVK